MASELMNLLMERKTAQLEQQYAAQQASAEQATTQLEQQMEHVLQKVVDEMLIARFPSAPISMVATIRELHAPERLQQLHRAIPHVPDQATAEAIVRDAATGSAR